MTQDAGLPGRVERLVLGWASTYTRGLGADATRRIDELRSDCYEQRTWGREVGASPLAVAISMMARTVAGMPADLLWRRATLADARDQPLLDKEAMMEQFKKTWWVWLGAVSCALVLVLGVGLPFEDRTAGAVVGGVVISLLGATGLAGVWVRRRHRVRGDLMIAAGVTPMLPFIWAVIPPIGAIVVITAAAIDAAHAQAGGTARSEAPAGHLEELQGRRDPVVTASVAILIAMVLAAVVIGDPGLAVVLVSPVLALLLAHLLLRHRLSGRGMLRTGLTLLVAGVAHSLLSYGTLLYEDTYFTAGDPVAIAVQTISSLAVLVGVALTVVGLRRGRDQARPA